MTLFSCLWQLLPHLLLLPFSIDCNFLHTNALHCCCSGDLRDKNAHYQCKSPSGDVWWWAVFLCSLLHSLQSTTDVASRSHFWGKCLHTWNLSFYIYCYKAYFGLSDFIVMVVSAIFFNFIRQIFNWYQLVLCLWLQ